MSKKAIYTVIFYFLFITITSYRTIFAEGSLILNPTKEVSLTNRYSDQTTGSLAVLRVSYTEGSGTQHITFLDFDLSEIPDLAKIESANLVLALKPESDDKDVPFSAMLLQEDWEQSTVTWNTRPKTIGNKFPTAAEDLQGYTRFNLTDLVQEWTNNKNVIFGFQLEGAKNSGYQKIFLSSNTNIPPKLEIEYSILLDTVMGTAEIAGTSEEVIRRDEKISRESILLKNLEDILAHKNVKTIIGGIFFLFLLKILVSKRS